MKVFVAVLVMALYLKASVGKFQEWFTSRVETSEGWPVDVYVCCYRSFTSQI